MSLYIIIIVSLIFSAFFSGSEIAFLSANKLRFEIDKQDNKFTGRIIDFFYRHQEQYISTMLVGNNIALVIYGIEMASLLATPLNNLIHNDVAVLILQTLIATLLVLIVGEFIPKTMFKANPNIILKIFSPIIFIIYIILFPITLLSTFLSKLFLRIFGAYNPKQEKQRIEKADLDYLINESIENQDSDPDIEHDVKIFQNALDFSNVKLRDCIVPRTEIAAIDEANTTIEDLQEAFTQSGYSKILIYRESIDNIIGYFHSNDLFKSPNNWHEYLRTMPFVPETMSASRLMDIFMQEKKSIAVVVDEFGGTAGIVTLEDIIEEIFGEIEDEHDSREYTAKKIDEKNYVLSGRLEIDYINSTFNLDLPESESYQTIAGFILHSYQKFPKLNDTINIEQFTFKILQAHNNRIDLVKLTINDEK